MSKHSAVAQYAMAYRTRKRWIEDDLDLDVEPEKSLGDGEIRKPSGGVLASVDDDDVFMTQMIKNASQRSSPIRSSIQQMLL